MPPVHVRRLVGISRLADLLILDKKERRNSFLMVFQVYNGYFDETGVDQETDLIGVGGWIGTYQSWIEFEKHWRSVLPNGETDFHYKNFWARRTYGADWTDKKRKEFVQKLGKIARDYTTYGVGMVISKKEYQDIIPIEHQQALKDPLYFCFGYCLTALLRWHKEVPSAPPTPLRFMFDRKNKPGDTTNLFYNVKSWYDRDNILGDLSFGQRHEEPALQAADLLVGEIRRHREGYPSIVLDTMRTKRRLLVSFPAKEPLKKIVRYVLDEKIGEH